MRKKLYIFVLLSFLFTTVVYADELNAKVAAILAGLNCDELSEEDIKEIMQAFRDAQLRGGPELDEAIKAAGFNPDLLKEPPRGQVSNMREEPPKDRPPTDNIPGKIFTSLETEYPSPGFTISSTAVNDNGELIDRFKCEKKVDGKENSIPLTWENVPKDAGSLAIVMYHYPEPNDKTHLNSYLLLWGIDPAVNSIPYSMADKGEWYMGANKDNNAVSYTSPCSHSSGEHEYVIALFALSKYPEKLPEKSTIDVNFEKFMSAVEESGIIAKAELSFKDIR